jgi:hypothetical protein
MPLMKIGRSVILLFVKLICTDLDSLSLIRHFLVQIAILFKADCNLMVDELTARIIVARYSQRLSEKHSYIYQLN